MLSPWLLILALWCAIRASGLVSPALVPAPHLVFTKAIELAGDRLWRDIYISTQRVFIGVTLGVALAVPVGFCLGWYQGLRSFIEPVINFFRPVITKLIAGWAEANAQIISRPDEPAEMLQKTQYPQVPLAEFKEQFKASKYYSNAEWRTRYQDGTVTKWLQQVTDFFVANANIQNALKADQYFDAKPFLETVKA